MNKLAEMRIRLNMSQEDVARKMNVTRIAVHNWEAGKANPSTSKLIKLASVLKCEVTDILCARG